MKVAIVVVLNGFESDAVVDDKKTTRREMYRWLPMSSSNVGVIFFCFFQTHYLLCFVLFFIHQVRRHNYMQKLNDMKKAWDSTYKDYFMREIQPEVPISIGHWILEKYSV